jgi:hypothetical protein
MRSLERNEKCFNFYLSWAHRHSSSSSSEIKSRERTREEIIDFQNFISILCVVCIEFNLDSFSSSLSLARLLLCVESSSFTLIGRSVVVKVLTVITAEIIVALQNGKICRLLRALNKISIPPALKCFYSQRDALFPNYRAAAAAAANRRR